MAQDKNTDPEAEAAAFINENVSDVKSAVQGAMDIIAENISDDAEIRKKLRELAVREGKIVSKAADEEAESVYSNYYDYYESVEKIAHHRILALDRGEKENFIKCFPFIEDAKRCGNYYSQVRFQ